MPFVTVAGACIEPWHGFDFELGTGRCGVDPDLAVPVYAVRVRGDVIEVEVP
jgi:nitrite reductase/ring-hydroxylating ferredoxin subunit